MDLHNVLVEPITTEKSAMLQDKATYVFKINKHATKIDVKNAVKMIYGGDVESVRITRTQPKSRFVGRNLFLKRRMGKKAVFRMKDGKAIDITKFVDSKKSKPKKK